MTCNKNGIIIVQGDDTDFSGSKFVNIVFNSTFPINGYSAKLKIGDLLFEHQNIANEWELELTADQTSRLKPGITYGSMVVYDTSDKKKTFTTCIPFYVIKDVCGFETDKDTIKFNLSISEGQTISFDIETSTSVELGTIETLPAGSEAYVRNVGTGSHLILNFGIPQGEKGDRGDNATINGMEAINIFASGGLEMEQDGANFSISGQAINERVSSIESKIPESASATNKLADIGFVIDKIQENSAHFRGNWPTYASIPTNPELYPADDEGNKKPTIHDYLIVMADETQGGGTWRYTYTGNWDTLGKSGWRAEYEIKDTPFTDRQWEAINSGATNEKIEQIADNTTNIENLTDRTTQAEADIHTLNTNKLQVNNIIAGDNITLSVDGNNITINGQQGGGGASSFSELSGSPYDNTALANALNEKASEADLQAVNDDIAQIQIDLSNKAEVSALNQTNNNLSALTGDVENVSGEVTAHATAIQNLEADKADKSTTYTKLETNDLLDAKANQNDLDATTAIAKGAQKGVSFSNYYNAVQNINTYDYDKYVVGQSVYIVTKEVPDLWVSAKYETSVPYVYISDDAIVEALKTSGVIRFGRYQLSPLETGKIDLSEYAKTSDLAQYIKKDGDETHNGKLTNTGVVDISSGAGAGALVLGADVNATTRTSGVRKLARINAPTNESNLDIPTTILSFDTQGDSASTIGQTGTGIFNRIEFGGRLGATTVTAPDGIAFTVAKVHNGMQQNQKVYVLEMSSSQARFNVQPNYNGASLATINDIKIKGVQQNGVDLIPDASGKVNVQATLVNVIEDD